MRIFEDDKIDREFWVGHNNAGFHVDFALYGTQAEISILSFHTLAGGTPPGSPSELRRAKRCTAVLVRLLGRPEGSQPRFQQQEAARIRVDHGMADRMCDLRDRYGRSGASYCCEVAVMGLTARGADIKHPEDVALGGQYLRNSRREVKGTMSSEKIGSGENITIQGRAVL